jgi:tripartite-type tricarboxylate transporter receptor subunit TctC
MRTVQEYLAAIDRSGCVWRAALMVGSLVSAPQVAVAADGAESYPARPLRMVVPFPAGGPTDISARILAQKLTEGWTRQVVVDNRGGANGIIGQDAVAKANPDGYTILVQSVAYAVNPSLYKLPYDSDRDFLPVTLVAATPLMLVVNPSIPAQSVQELIVLARAKPNQLNYASFGNGSIAHLAGELLKTSAGISMTHVAYKGVPQSISDVVAGQCQLMFPTIPSALPFTKTNRLRGLAVTSRQRTSLAPDLPTMPEAGVRGYEASTWFGVFLPAGVPQPIVSKLHAQLVRIMGQPDVKAQFDTQGFELHPMTPEEFKRFIRGETDKYAKVVKAAGVKVE